MKIHCYILFPSTYWDSRPQETEFFMSSPHLFISPQREDSDQRTLCLAKHVKEVLHIHAQGNPIKNEDLNFSTVQQF